jgi:hypothetical protein
MSEIKRYDFDINRVNRMELDPQGEWVRWEDVENIVELIAEIQENHLRKCLTEITEATEALLE